MMYGIYLPYIVFFSLESNTFAPLKKPGWLELWGHTLSFFCIFVRKSEASVVSCRMKTLGFRWRSPQMNRSWWFSWRTKKNGKDPWVDSMKGKTKTHGKGVAMKHSDRWWARLYHYIPYHPWDWYIYLHLVDFFCKCRAIYHTWMVWV